ncbi:MAG: hypothetical protein ACI406_08915 [Victivallis vadensis]
MNKAEKSRNLRYRRPALTMIRRDAIMDEINEIGDECAMLEYAVEDDEKLIDAFDGDSDEAFEFRMMFSALTDKCERLTRALTDADVTEHFDDFFVGLLGGGAYKVIGFDSFEEDYFALTQFDAELAHEVAGKRLMGLTKENLIATAGQCIGIMMSLLDIRHSYDCLKSTLDILRDERAEVMKNVKGISEAYDKVQENPYNREARNLYESLLERLPDVAWVQ